MFYALSKIFLLFIVYSFLGWFMETITCFLTTKKFTNRGFLLGPCCPIYGLGVLLIILLLRKYQKYPLALFTMAIIICSLLEYITSWLMEIIFKNRWWDYSDKKFNINGRICLETMIPFGIIGTFVFYILNPTITKLISFLPNILTIIIAIIFFVLFTIDVSISFNIIVKLKNVGKSIKMDSTDEITKKVREILLNKSFLHRRLVKAFPHMQIKKKTIHR